MRPCSAVSDVFAIASARGNGLIHSADLNDLGLNARDIARSCHQQRLIRVRRGVYVVPPQTGTLTSSEMHRLLVRATNTVMGDAVVSHESAAGLHRLPLIGRWPQLVHTTQVDAPGGSSSRGIQKHTSAAAPPTVVVDGVRTTSIARTLLDVATSKPLITSVAMLDHALRERLVTVDELFGEFADLGKRPGLKRCAQALELADGRSGSPGESLSRTRAHELGFEAPELQVSVLVDGERFEVDFGWESVMLFGEFDGALKYTRSAEVSGLPASQVVFAEKRREDKIRRATHRSFLRWTWDEAMDPRVFHRLLADAGVPQTRRS